MGIIRQDQIDEGRRGPKQWDELRGLNRLTKERMSPKSAHERARVGRWVKNGETHQGGRVTETDGSSDVSNPSPYTAHREPAYLLERVCTGYKNGLAVGGFKGKRG
jgi:hypothetical protein